MKSGRMQWAMLAWLVALARTPAHAHNLDERYGPFLGNFLHPLTSLDHGLVFLALGLLAGQQGRKTPRLTIGSFVIGLFVGTSLPVLLGLQGDSVPQLTTLNVASVVVLGALIALARPLPVSLVMVVASLIGVSHGFENSIGMAPESRSLVSVAGVITAGLSAGVLFATLATAVRAAWLQIAVRVMGSWIVAIGLIMLGFQFRQTP